MYETMMTITIVAVYGLFLAEMGYHGRKMYVLWLNDEMIRDYIIPYDPVLKTCRYRDGADWMFAAFFRLVALALVPVIAGLAWPATLTIGVFIGFANYQKYVLRIKKTLEEK